MEEAEHSRYVAQLKVEFDSCDTTASGFLDGDELTALCRKLQLDAHLPLLLDTLLGGRRYARVNFQEFKEGFVAVLSRSLDFSTSEDDSSYLEPVVPEEVKPKFVKGTKRYGRRSRPDSKPDTALACDSEDSPRSRTEASDSSPSGARRAKLRRSTSLESVESLKSDEETGSQKENLQPDFQSKGAGGGAAAVCEQLSSEEQDQYLDQDLDQDQEQEQDQDLDLDLLLRTTDLDGRAGIRAPVSCSTPVRSADLQRAPHRSPAVCEERSARSASPSLLTATVGQRVLSRLDEGSGCTSPEKVVALWTEEGLRNSRDILQTLDFPLEERLSLADLTLALDNELLVSGNGIHQAALLSYKNEIQHLQTVAEQALRQRDKVKADLEQADHRNLQLVREVDDRHASMESLNQSRIRELEQDFRDRLTALRSQSEQESEAQLQQADRERRALQDELRRLRAQEAELQERLGSATQENGRLEEDVSAVKLKLSEAESSVNRLQRDLEQLLQHKFGSLDPAAAGLSHEERFCDIIREYELQCRELRDRNDELSSELELLKTQRSDRTSRRAAAALSWTQQRAASADSDSDESDMKRSSSPQVRKKLQPADKTALGSLDSVSGPAVSIQTELALEQLQQRHREELQQLQAQLHTQVNFYERSLEVMRQSMEVERKDISQAFKMEISELEEQKAQAELQVKQLKENVDKLHAQIQHGGAGGGAGGWSSEQERRMQRERAELEQNFAREIGNLVQRLSGEKEQLEAELKLKMDQEVMLVREEQEEEEEEQEELRAFWEHRLAQSQQDRAQEEQEQQEELKEQHEEQEEQEEQQEEQQDSSLQELRGRCAQLEERLEEACTQLEESVSFMEAQEVLNRRLASERSCVEEQLQQTRSSEEQLREELTQLQEELQQRRSSEEQLLQQVTQLQGEVGSLLQERGLVAENCSRLSDAFIQQQGALRAREHTVGALRQEVQAQQEVLCRLTAELDSLKTDRARLIQDLKEQAMAVDTLQLELDSGSEEVQRRRSAEEALQEALQQEQGRSSQLRSSLEEEVQRRRSTEEALQEEQGRSSQLRSSLEEEVERRRSTKEALQEEQSRNSQLRYSLEEEVERRRSTEEALQEEQGRSSQLRSSLEEEVERRRSTKEALHEEQSRSSQLRSHLEEEQEEVQCLEQENRSYTRLADQLSTQIVEMEEEIWALREQLKEVREQLKEVREQLNSRAGEVERLRGEEARLQRLLQESQQRLAGAEEDFEEEKRRMKQQLEELEELVLALEEVMDPASPHRTQLEEVRSENGALQERLSVLQQEVQQLEEQLCSRRRREEELEGEHGRSRGEEERLHRENNRYREEVLELSSRNLQLSNDNAELSARLHGDQESVRMLRERLATVSKEKEEEGAEVRRLQDAALQQQTEELQLQVLWTQERQQLEAELNSCREKLGALCEAEQQLSRATMRLQQVEDDNTRLLRDTDHAHSQVEQLQLSLLSAQSEAELLRSQLLAVTQEKLSHKQEVSELQGALQDAHSKVEALESSVRRLQEETEKLRQAQEEQQQQASVTLQEEAHGLRLQNQELQQQLSRLQVEVLEVQTLTQEQQTLRSRLKEQEEQRLQSQEQALRADTALALLQAQRARRLQEPQAGDGCREQVELLTARLQEEQSRSWQLEEALRVQSQHSSSHISSTQEQYEKALSALRRRTDELEVKLQGVRLVLQEKVQELKEQLARNTKSSVLLKDVYVENSQLMKALQVTERRQKHAEKKNFLLEEKVTALSKLLREIVPAALAT